jgi:ribosomal protein S18 acetylase RimI-like enzyme
MTQIGTLTLSAQEALDGAEEEIISDGLYDYSDAFAPPRNWAPLWVVGRDANGAVQGGLRAVTFFDWMTISLFWIAEPYRRQGIGSRMLAEAETVARSRGVANVYVETHTFQAPGFYEKHGYREFGRLENFPRGHARIYLVKRF